MEKQKKVLDASVLFKLFSEEIYSDVATKLIEEHVNGKSLLIITSFTILEIMNGLRYKEKSSEKLKLANEYLKNLELKVDNITKELVDKAIDISYKYKITIYDALYIALSQFHGCPLITADKELYKIPNIIPIEKFE